MKTTLQSMLAIAIISIGIDANAQTRYLDDVFSTVTVTSDVIYANNISILPALMGLPPAPTDLTCDIYEPSGDTQSCKGVSRGRIGIASNFLYASNYS